MDDERVARGARHIHIIAPTAADCRDVLAEGPAGLIATAPPDMRPIYTPSLRKLVWPNGAQALLFSADEPDRLRGPQCDTLVIDELAAMRLAQEVLDMALMGLRLGKDARCIIATTPRPLKCIKSLLAREGVDVAITRGSTHDNRANLAPNFFHQVIGRTRAHVWVGGNLCRSLDRRPRCAVAQRAHRGVAGECGAATRARGGGDRPIGLVWSLERRVRPCRGRARCQPTRLCAR